ncbi:MAG: hypothetical protein M1816_005939, partial [Peltula sp. TS41687]
SPLPNPKLWHAQTIGRLQRAEGFVNGGWWHDARILAATGQGLEKEEPRAWEGWWNEHIVALVELTMQQKDTLSVLLTGRSDSGFSGLVKRMVASKKLDFHMICLKPEAGPNNQQFTHTSSYKQAVLEDLMYTYKDAEEIRVYEDRPNHVKFFREFLASFNNSLNNFLMVSGSSAPRKPIRAEVVEVAELATNLDPVVEVTEVQRMINDHNLAISNAVPSQYGRLTIKRTFFFTGYIISSSTTEELVSLAHIQNDISENEIRYLANNILIAPRPLPPKVLEKVGGIGKKVKWEVTGTGVFDDKVWAASVRPVPETERYYTETPAPLVVLALRRGARAIDANQIQSWEPVPPDKAYVFDTVVGEKVLLRIEEENTAADGEWESVSSRRNFKRRYPRDADVVESPLDAVPVYQQHNHNYYPPRAQGDSYRGESYHRFHGGNNRGRGGGGGYRGHRGGGGGGGSYRGHRGDRGASHYRGRGRGAAAGGGGQYGYRSLDDMPQERNFNGGGGGSFGQDGADDPRDSESGGGGVRVDYSNGGGTAGLPYNG